MAAFPFPNTFSFTKSSFSKSLTTGIHERVLLVSPTSGKNTLNTSNYSPQITLCAPSNSPLWSVTDIAQAVDGRIVKWGPPGTISTDTRTIEPGQWFFAIAGENFDAHDFVTLELYRSGCVGVIGNRVCENWKMGFVQIDGDTVSSLLKMATFARNRLLGKVIAVTGSVGKTTTKTMIALGLESLGSEVYQSYGNWNNRIGVALSLIGIPRNVGISVLEMGMDRRGEILELARLGKPDIRVILNVGASHLGNLGSLEEIAMAKGEILEEAKPRDICVLNADDPLVMSLLVPPGVTRVLFGRSLECDVRLVAAESVCGGLGVRVVLQKNMEMVEFVIPGLGLHLALNACAAAAVVTSIGVPLSQVGRSLSRYVPVSMRSEFIVAKSGIKIVNDVYNANPVSMKATIDMLQRIGCDGKRVAILGDMLGLGPLEMEYHEEILNYCLGARIDVVGVAGKRFHLAADNKNLMKKMKIVHAIDSENLVPKILKFLNMNDVVLVKGSRGMRMEKVVEALVAMPRLTPPPCSENWE
ncbi:UDP-N-acetylmuramoyl-tripeptide--D-alanyl-D-alanine ligase-like [Hibiscus syriacus]|uniref:UDP-N-acetylmuramoyl-tripeptide--D-alanyl-D- alanine ligase-like n=1 Tax=Hibiscus syriacus TaxID=106335 RepID=UPI001923242B|nr:UDP-N-acetylmuramoyl-tripeptide--D-alanyl-D-alanine ligase-like [Hibiscus syriacus]